MPSFSKPEGDPMHTQTAIKQTRQPVALSQSPGVPTLGDLFKAQPTESVAPGGAIFWQGDPAAHIFEVTAGVLRVYRVLADGRRAIMGFIHPGEVLGVSVQSHYLFT